MRLAVLSLLACLVATPAFADPVDDVITAQMARSHIPGAAVAVVERGKVVKLSGYGKANLEWDAPVDTDTTFQIASATKLFTGIVLMRLVERGELSLDDSLSKYFPDGPASWRGIRVGQLANHTSGLTQGFGANAQYATFDEFLTATKPLPLVHEPGARSQYGLSDSILLQAVLEKVSGKPLPTLFADEIFKPLGLTRTGFNHAANRGTVRWAGVLPKRASVYAWEDGQQHISDNLYRPITYAAGGLFSSASDLARVFAAIDEGKLLNPESLRLIETPPVLTDGSRGGFGVGWTTRTYRGAPIVGHSGGPALADVVRSEDRKLTIIVLTNQHRFYPLLAESVADLYLPAGPRAKAIADKRTALTATVKAILTSAATGKVDPAVFTEAGAGEMVPFFVEMRGTLLTAVGPFKSADLIADSVKDGKVRRKYRVAFESRELFWNLTAEIGGKVVELIPVGEAD